MRPCKNSELSFPLLMGMLLTIVFSSILFSLESLTRESTCKLLNMSFDEFMCSGNVNMCKSTSCHETAPILIPCQTKNYKMIYDVIETGTNAVTQLCSDTSFTQKTQTCFCSSSINNKINKYISYGNSDKCKPIITLDTDDYSNRIIGDTYKCWISISNNKIKSFSDKDHGVETSLILWGTVSFTVALCSFILICRNHIKMYFEHKNQHGLDCEHGTELYFKI